MGATTSSPDPPPSGGRNRSSAEIGWAASLPPPPPSGGRNRSSAEMAHVIRPPPPPPGGRNRSSADASVARIRPPLFLPPFYMGFRLADIGLDCGSITRSIYDRAPGGPFGKVFVGRWRGLDVAVKILASRPGLAPGAAAEAFRFEVQNMIAVRSKIDRACMLQRHGADLSETCDLAGLARRCATPHRLDGWANVVLVYGVGTEMDLSAIAPGLPPGPAHLIVMEKLTGDTLEVPPGDIYERVRVAAALAGGLSFLAAAHVVHAHLKGGNLRFRSPGGDVVITDCGGGHIAYAGVNSFPSGRDLHAGVAADTMVYLAPELIGGRHANTFASDVYVQRCAK